MKLTKTAAGLLGALCMSLSLSSALTTPAMAQQQSFDAWLQDVRTEARQRGIREDIITKTLVGIQPKKKIVQLDRKQPEFKQTFQTYLSKRVTATRIKAGKKKQAQYGALLNEVSAVYGVQPRFILALWGMETNYGGYTGNTPVITALATLAYDGRRSAYFRKEMFNALRILNENHITPERMIGSWAGAMGQSQFMPSSFLKLAEDYNGDGRRDIWTSVPDVFASIANYLRSTGWRDDETWGRKVMLTRPISSADMGLKKKRSLAYWQQQGVRRITGADLPNVPHMQGALVRMDNGKGPAYLAYGNFKRIMLWNRSTSFAAAVGTLSDQFK